MSGKTKVVLKKTGIVLCVLLVLLLGLLLAAGPVVKALFNSAAPSFLGVEVAHVEKLSVNVFTGEISLGGLRIGNPEGFNTESLFELESVEMKVSVKSLFSDTIVIPYIRVQGTDLTYEKGFTSSNLSTLLERFESEEKEKKEKNEEEGKKVIIEDLLIEDTTLHLALTITQGLAAPIPLPAIHLTGIGAPKDESKGTTILGALIDILKAVLGATTDVVGATVGAAVDVVGAVGGGVMDIGAATGEAIADGAKAIAGFFGDDGDEADGDKAEADGESTGDAAGETADGADAGNAIANGAKAIAGFFGGGDDAPDGEDAESTAGETDGDAAGQETAPEDEADAQ